jgi:hypothetical protein
VTSPGPTVPDVAIPLCEVQFGLQETLQPRQGKERNVQEKTRFYYDRRKTKLSSFVYFLLVSTDVNMWRVWGRREVCTGNSIKSKPTRCNKITVFIDLQDLEDQ